MISNKDITVFAETTYRNQFKKFGIKTDDRRRHMYVIGKTGMGKSTILENMIIEDIRAGKGVAVVDPHGDLAEKIIEFIPDDRVKDIIYFNPADIEYPIAFNVVEKVAPHLRHLVASGLIGVFQKLWADSWGPRLEYILRNSILAILDFPGATLMSVVRMLSDKEYRKKVIDNIQDPVVKAFWVKEFAGYNDKFASEAVAPIQNKVGQFLSSSLIRNIVGQNSSALDLRKVMDERKILIMNLSKGRIGEDNTELLGAMMITKIQLAAMSRVDTPEEEREDFYLYVDEFQNFATDSFANILSEARKYRLSLIMGHQYIEQLSDKVKAAVFGNVGTLVTFRVGAIDAEELVKEFTPTFSEEDLVNLPKYNICLKLMIDGVASDPFSARGLPPIPETERTHNFDKVIKATRETYSNDREAVEDAINKWHDDNIDTTKKGPGNEKDGFNVTCDSCGDGINIPFKPDGIRPVFCKKCLAKTKDERRTEIEARKIQKKAELERLNNFDKVVHRSVGSDMKKGSEQIKKVEESTRSVKKEEPVKTTIASPPKFSLSELSNKEPVDFKGRTIREKKVYKKKNPVQVSDKAINDSNVKVESAVENIKPIVQKPVIKKIEDNNINQQHNKLSDNSARVYSEKKSVIEKDNTKSKEGDIML